MTSMRFRVLSHAGLQVQAGGRELLCDPWVLGSCYWRSWWNYPPVPERVRRELEPDFIYLTHLHWDHFQGPSLRLFPKSTQLVVPYCRYDRIKRDLVQMGYTNVIELKHGERLELAPNFAIRSYHFAPIFTDSALVIEADGVVLFNANDAKLAGWPLQQVLSDYPSIDFCFRSHNSANARHCMHIIGEPAASLDDNDHYVRAFGYFMHRVKPRYAIPFASNSCLLHKDVFHMNSLTQTPVDVAGFFQHVARQPGFKTQLQIMVPGDSWSSESGFQLQEHDYFARRHERLAEYARECQPKLDEFYAREAKVKVSLDTLKTFIRELHAVTPWILRRGLRGQPVLIGSRTGETTHYFAVDLGHGTVEEVPAAAAPDYGVRAEFPSLVLLQSIRLNMFSQAWISKRVHYYARREQLQRLQRFLTVLELWEAELLPIRDVVTWRAVRALLPRWREAFLYAHVALHLAKGRSMLEIERRLLGGQLASLPSQVEAARS